MNSICFISNSHAAGIIRLLSKKDPIGIDIFAAGGKRLHAIGLKDGVLHLNKNSDQFNSNTDQTTIEVREYQHIIIYGCQVISRYGGTFWLSNYYDTVSQMYSEACINSLHLDALKSSIGFKIIKLIRASGYEGRITLIPSPLPNELHPDVENEIYEETPLILRSIGRLYSEELTKQTVSFHMLPEELLAKNNYTTSQLFLNEQSGKDEDFAHLNIDGSKLVLDDLLEYIDSV